MGDLNEQVNELNYVMYTLINLIKHLNYKYRNELSAHMKYKKIRHKQIIMFSYLYIYIHIIYIYISE